VGNCKEKETKTTFITIVNLEYLCPKSAEISLAVILEIFDQINESTTVVTENVFCKILSNPPF